MFETFNLFLIYIHILLVCSLAEPSKGHRNLICATSSLLEANQLKFL